MKIIVFANEDKWKYDDSFFYYPVCLPSLKLITDLSLLFKLPILFVTNKNTKDFIFNLSKANNFEYFAVEYVENIDFNSFSAFLFDLNSPLVYYEKDFIIQKMRDSLADDKIINLNYEFYESPFLKQTFKIRETKDFEKLYFLVSDLSRKYNKNVIFLGSSIFVCPLSSFGNNNVILDNTFVINSKIGNFNRIGPNSFITNCDINDNNVIEYSFVKNSKLIDFNKIGPFSHIREGNVINSSKIGAFVECKNVKVSSSLKASHLAYLGDLLIEDNVNIGAGVVFANYDGKNKYTTVIKKDSFIGSNSVVISPKNIGQCSYIGAGSVVTKDVPDFTVVFGNPAKVHKVLQNKVD